MNARTVLLLVSAALLACGLMASSGMSQGLYSQAQNDEGREEYTKQVVDNCNVPWAGCVNVCNTLPDPNQRAVCIANCNNARNICIKNGMDNYH
jgi:hypothetical protein